MPESLDLSEEELAIAEQAFDITIAQLSAQKSAENANRDQQQNQAEPERPDATG